MLHQTTLCYEYICDKCGYVIHSEWPLSSWEYSDDYICPKCGDGPDVQLRTVDWISNYLFKGGDNYAR